MRKISLFSILLVLIGVSAFAENPQNYATLKLGGYLPQSSDVEELDNSFYGELGFGHYFNQNWAVEMGVGYTKSTADVSASSGSTTGSASVDLTIIPITLGVKGSVPMGGFTPYATAGIGLYYTKADVSASVSGLGSASASENDTPVGFYLGLGGDFNIAPNIFLGLEGKYFWAKPSFEGESVNIDGINMTANIGYRF
jgi:opacity protein-like surface antigen